MPQVHFHHDQYSPPVFTTLHFRFGGGYAFRQSLSLRCGMSFDERIRVPVEVPIPAETFDSAKKEADEDRPLDQILVDCVDLQFIWRRQPD